MTGFIFVVELALGWIQFQGFAWTVRPISNIIASLGYWTIYMISIAVAEELIFRGWLLGALDRWIGMRLAVLLSSVMFGLVHLLNSSNQGANALLTVTGTTLFGIIAALAYLLNRSMWMPIGIHWAWNVFQIYFGLADQESKLFVLKFVGTNSQTGLPSTFGPETSLLGWLVMTATIVVLWFFVRQKAKSETSS